MTPLSRLLIIIGPSGAGKSSVVRELHRRGATLVRPTWTTRPPRPEEIDGCLEHRFVSEEEFDEFSHRGFFCHTGTIAGLPYRYGLPAFGPHADGPRETVILRAPYVEKVARLVPGTVVYQIQGWGDRVAQRIGARGCPPAEVDTRIRDNITESQTGWRVAHRTFVNEGTIGELVDVVAEAMVIDLPGRSGAAAAVAL